MRPWARYAPLMLIRAMTPDDIDMLREIDGTIESCHYLHLDRAGEGLCVSWNLRERELHQRRIDPNPMHEETLFDLKQVLNGVEEGLALIAEHDDQPVAMLLAREMPDRRTLNILDARIDFDLRRQGIGTAFIYQAIQHARQRGLRAVSAEVRTDNLPACKLLLKCGFDLAGVDAQRHTNHDLVSESATLFWYAALD